MDGVLDHVTWVHGLLQAAGDALHGGTVACDEWRRKRTYLVERGEELKK